MPFKIRIRLKIKIQALEEEYTLCLCTNLLRKDLIEGKKTRKNIEIIPQMDGVWDFIDVSVFLNNVLSDWVKEKRTPRIFKSDPSTKSIVAIYTFIHPNDWHFKVHIHVDSKTKKNQYYSNNRLAEELLA